MKMNVVVPKTQVVVFVYHVQSGATLHGFLRIWMSARQSAIGKGQLTKIVFGVGIFKKCEWNENYFCVVLASALRVTKVVLNSIVYKT